MPRIVRSGAESSSRAGNAQPDDFELFLEGILEAPRGPRQVLPGPSLRPGLQEQPDGGRVPLCGTAGGNGGCDVRRRRLRRPRRCRRPSASRHAVGRAGRPTPHAGADDAAAPAMRPSRRSRRRRRRRRRRRSRPPADDGEPAAGRGPAGPGRRDEAGRRRRDAARGLPPAVTGPATTRSERMQGSGARVRNATFLPADAADAAARARRPLTHDIRHRWSIMKDVQRIAIVDPSDATREELRNVLLGMESVWLEAECSRYEFFFDVIQPVAARTWSIVSLDSDQTKALQLIAPADAGVPGLADPGRQRPRRRPGDPAGAAQRRQGVPDRPGGAGGAAEGPAAAAPRAAAAATASGVQRQRAKVESQVIAVLGSRGGVGCTSLAVNLGATLAQDPTNSVALIDLDLALGDADVALDLMRRLHPGRRGPEHRAARHDVPAALAEQARLRPVAAAAPGADGGRRPDPRGAPAARHRPAAGQLHAPDPRPEQELLARPT